jgi:diadenosine tetraphosphate (Ap4A) HIT family hydrolase
LAAACKLCRALANATREAEPSVCNARLLETPQFIAMPSLGPLVRGQVMVVSKIHAESLASMGSDALGEYDALALRLRKAASLLGANPLEAEHGSTAGDKAGACVVHTHVHWLPEMGDFLGEFRKR